MKQLTVDDLRVILVDNFVRRELLDGNLNEKKLVDDLRMDSLDIAGMISEIEKVLGVTIPDETWGKWERSLRSLTIQEVIDDCNKL